MDPSDFCRSLIAPAAEGLPLALEVCQATQYTMPEPLDTLAAAQAANENYREATETAKRALSLGPDSGVSQRIRERLGLYEQGKAFVQTRKR